MVLIITYIAVLLLASHSVQICWSAPRPGSAMPWSKQRGCLPSLTGMGAEGGMCGMVLQSLFRAGERLDMLDFFLKSFCKFWAHSFLQHVRGNRGLFMVWSFLAEKRLLLALCAFCSDCFAGRWDVAAAATVSGLVCLFSLAWSPERGVEKVFVWGLWGLLNSLWLLCYLVQSVIL